MRTPTRRAGGRPSRPRCGRTAWPRTARRTPRGPHGAGCRPAGVSTAPCGPPGCCRSPGPPGARAFRVPRPACPAVRRVGGRAFRHGGTSPPWHSSGNPGTARWMGWRARCWASSGATACWTARGGWSLAFSGGPDSAALALLLIELADRLGVSLRLAHLNHCLRGAESDADEAFCRAFAAERGLEIDVERADVAAAAARDGRSVEAQARRMRYDFLGRCAKACGAEAVATGHHADDVAESVLLRLLRGAGVLGLGAMAPRRPLGRRHPDVRLVRPMLEVRRDDVLDYLKTARAGLPHRQLERGHHLRPQPRAPRADPPAAARVPDVLGRFPLRAQRLRAGGGGPRRRAWSTRPGPASAGSARRAGSCWTQRRSAPWRRRCGRRRPGGQWLR